jgi:hypothetical protein
VRDSPWMNFFFPSSVFNLHFFRDYPQPTLC